LNIYLFRLIPDWLISHPTGSPGRGWESGARFSNEQHPVCKSDDNKYLIKRVHEPRRDKIHIYHPILKSKKLLIFFYEQRISSPRKDIRSSFEVKSVLLPTIITVVPSTKQSNKSDRFHFSIIRIFLQNLIC
jgi:hypothetical protein